MAENIFGNFQSLPLNQRIAKASGASDLALKLSCNPFYKKFSAGIRANGIMHKYPFERV